MSRRFWDSTTLRRVAAVSLLVGGIGIRLAIGALEREALMQFLLEAMILSSFGGAIGVALALVASAACAILLHVPFIFNIGIVVFAFLLSATIGVVFGYFPALKAASLDPIEALRHE